MSKFPPGAFGPAAEIRVFFSALDPGGGGVGGWVWSSPHPPTLKKNPLAEILSKSSSEHPGTSFAQPGSSLRRRASRSSVGFSTPSLSGVVWPGGGPPGCGVRSLPRWACPCRQLSTLAIRPGPPPPPVTPVSLPSSGQGGATPHVSAQQCTTRRQDLYPSHKMGFSPFGCRCHRSK